MDDFLFKFGFWVKPLNAEINKWQPKWLIHWFCCGSFQVELQFGKFCFCSCCELSFFLKWYLDRSNCCYSDKLCQPKKDTGFLERQTIKMYKILKIKLHNPPLNNLYVWISPIHICTSFISFLTSDKYPTLTFQVLHLLKLHCFTEIV